MKRFFLVIPFVVFLFAVQSGVRSHYIHTHEFKPAKSEWDAAYDRSDRAGMLAAFDKEMIAHCRTIDPFWFYSRWANKCD